MQGINRKTCPTETRQSLWEQPSITETKPKIKNWSHASVFESLHNYVWQRASTQSSGLRTMPHPVKKRKWSRPIGGLCKCDSTMTNQRHIRREEKRWTMCQKAERSSITAPQAWYKGLAKHPTENHNVEEITRTPQDWETPLEKHNRLQPPIEDQLHQPHRAGNYTGT